ncbi:hypothetical protein CPZ06_10215 [Lactobacillus acidophilus]|nr:hypothetical protein CPZ06_10215 [Lactobacillus acidophilus]
MFLGAGERLEATDRRQKRRPDVPATVHGRTAFAGHVEPPGERQDQRGLVHREQLDAVLGVVQAARQEHRNVVDPQDGLRVNEELVRQREGRVGDDRRSERAILRQEVHADPAVATIRQVRREDVEARSQELLRDMTGSAGVLPHVVRPADLAQGGDQGARRPLRSRKELIALLALAVAAVHSCADILHCVSIVGDAKTGGVLSPARCAS